MTVTVTIRIFHTNCSLDESNWRQTNVDRHTNTHTHTHTHTHTTHIYIYIYICVCVCVCVCVCGYIQFIIKNFLLSSEGKFVLFFPQHYVIKTDIIAYYLLPVFDFCNQTWVYVNSNIRPLIGNILCCCKFPSSTWLFKITGFHRFPLSVSPRIYWFTHYIGVKYPQKGVLGKILNRIWQVMLSLWSSGWCVKDPFMANTLKSNLVPFRLQFFY